MIDLSALGLRDYLLIAAVLAGAYFLLSLLPLLRMLGRRRPAAAPPAMEEPSVSAAGHAEAGARQEAVSDEPALPRYHSEPVADAPSPAIAGDFSRELAASSRDLELRRLRGEMDQVLAELARLSEEVSALRASRSVSPQYSEAMNLALEGESPGAIAERCGISIGEAELVAALARGRSGTEPDGANEGRYLDQGHRDG